MQAVKMVRCIHLDVTLCIEGPAESQFYIASKFHWSLEYGCYCLITDFYRLIFLACACYYLDLKLWPITDKISMLLVYLLIWHGLDSGLILLTLKKFLYCRWTVIFYINIYWVICNVQFFLKLLVVELASIPFFSTSGVG